jgi:hypothetical protein
MSAHALHRKVRSELAALVAQGLLTYEQAWRIAERYPVARWDLASLARWFTLLGAVAMGVGLLLLAPKLMDVQLLVEVGLAVASVGLLALGVWLERYKQRVRMGAALQLLGAMALQGLTVALAVHYSQNSGDWPALVGLDAVLLLGLAYALRSRLILIYACVNLFVWFGGRTGYISGWGAYWLGMTWPLRFTVAGVVSLVVAWAHYRWLRGALQGFSRVWAHFGLLILHLSLWFMAVFGYFEERVRWSSPPGERVAFSVLWAAVAGACVWGSTQVGLRMLRGYGLTFLVINLYTFYFQFIVFGSEDWWFLHLLLVGGSLLGLGFWLERRLRSSV